MKEDNANRLPNELKLIVIVVICLIALSLIFGSFYIIKAGQRGVILTFGELKEEAVSEGFHLKIPFVQKLIKFDITTQKYEVDASAASSDLQIVTAKIAVNFHLLPESTPEIYRNIGLNYHEKVITPSVQEAIKASTAQFTAEQLITKREEVNLKIVEVLRNKLTLRGIIVENIAITNFDFSKSFNEAIESKVTAEQLKLKADRDLERIKIEAEQKITQARAEAEALKLQKQQITEDLVKLRQIDAQREAIAKWNGELPSIVGSGAIPFIQIPTEEIKR